MTPVMGSAAPNTDQRGKAGADRRGGEGGEENKPNLQRCIEAAIEELDCAGEKQMTCLWQTVRMLVSALSAVEARRRIRSVDRIRADMHGIMAAASRALSRRMPAAIVALGMLGWLARLFT